MMHLIFATNNENKVKELRSVLNERFHIITLKEAGIDIDIPEPHDTIEANASEKSSVIYQLTHKNCFAEDTGLLVDALHGEPGVKSARYAGEGKNFDDNIDKLLKELRSDGLMGEESRVKSEERNAHFKTVISLILDGKEYLFEGICNGQIIHERRGTNGFGYDPVFIPDGSTRTFAEMTMEEKNVFSHRKKAVEKLVEFLSTS